MGRVILRFDGSRCQEMLSASPVFAFSLMLVLISHALQFANDGQAYYCDDKSSRSQLQHCFNTYLEKLPDECKYNDTVAVILISKEDSKVNNIVSTTAQEFKDKPSRFKYSTSKPKPSYNGKAFGFAAMGITLIVYYIFAIVHIKLDV